MYIYIYNVKLFKGHNVDLTADWSECKCDHRDNDQIKVIYDSVITQYQSVFIVREMVI